MIKKLKLKYNYILLIIQFIILAILFLNIASVNSIFILYYINLYYIFKNIYYILKKEK